VTTEPVAGGENARKLALEPAKQSAMLIAQGFICMGGAVYYRRRTAAVSIESLVLVANDARSQKRGRQAAEGCPAAGVAIYDHSRCPRRAKDP
jgi:hypothetical protein